MSLEDREAVDLPEKEAEKLRMGIEAAVNRAAEAGWNAGQIKEEVAYAIDVYEEE